MTTPHNQLEQDLLDLLHQEQKRNASATQDNLPQLPPELFGSQAPQQVRQASASHMSADAYLDFLQPPSPGKNVAEIGLDSLWERPPALPVEASEDPLASLWTSEPAPPASIPAPIQASGELDLSGLWSTAPGSDHDLADLEGLWDAPGRSTAASDEGDALSSIFMNGDAMAQAEMVGLSLDAGDIPLPSPRVAALSREFNIEFDADFGDVNLPAPSRAGRFRIDQPPPRSSFRGSTVGQDGVVVGQRGADGRFRTAAVRPVVVRPAPAPAPRTEAPKVAVTQTTYDVLRKGGLDL